MSDPIRKAGLALLLCSLLPAAAQGQDRAALEARATLLRRDVAELSRRVGRRDSISRAALGWDSLQIGSLELHFAARDLSLVRAAAVRALDSVAPLLGAPGARRLQITIYPTLRTPRTKAAPDSGWQVDRLSTPRPGTPVTTSFVERADSVAGLAVAIARIAPEALWAQGDTSLLAWLNLPPQLHADSAALQAAYIALATRPERVARRCFAEELAACSAALGLLPPGTDLHTWYDAEEIRALVKAVTSGGEQRGRWSTEVRECVMSQDPATCDRLLALQNPLSLPAPLAGSARGALVALALQGGGPGAIDRLLATPAAPLTARLASAAAQPYDSLLSRWRAAVGRARPEPVGPGVAPTITAFGWTVLLLGLALGGTRWRDR
jgi:hypothetical protein